MTPTTHHLRFISENYNTMSDKSMAKALGVSYNFVYGLRKRNKLTKCHATWCKVGGQMERERHEQLKNK